MSKIANININHVALSVPDLDAASKFYEEVFGFRKIRTDFTHDRATDPNGIIFRIYGDRLQKVKVAYMTSGNGVGWELFQFIDPAHEGRAKSDSDDKPFPYTLGGYYHVAVTVHNVDEVIEKVVAAGGKHIGEAVCIFHDTAAYVQDPWGNIIELLTSSFEHLMANQG